jgi:hypothetical protein
MYRRHCPACGLSQSLRNSEKIFANVGSSMALDITPGSCMSPPQPFSRGAQQRRDGLYCGKSDGHLHGNREGIKWGLSFLVCLRLL